MNANPAPESSSKERAISPGWAGRIFKFLRTSWLTGLVLLGVVAFGLWKGFSTQRQWSDALFLAGVAQILIAWLSVLDFTGETSDASTVRYIPRSDIGETRQQLILNSLRRHTFATATFVGGLLSMLLAFLVMQV